MILFKLFTDLYVYVGNEIPLPIDNDEIIDINELCGYTSLPENESFNVINIDCTEELLIGSQLTFQLTSGLPTQFILYNFSYEPKPSEFLKSKLNCTVDTKLQTFYVHIQLAIKI